MEQKILHSINALLLMIFLLVAFTLNTWLVHSILISKSICSQFLKPWNTFDDQDFYCIFQISSIRHKERLWKKKFPKIKYIRYVSRNLFVLTLNSTNNTYEKKQTKTQYIRINIWCIIVEVESFFFLSRIAMQKFISTFPATDNEFQCFILRVQLI